MTKKQNTVYFSTRDELIRVCLDDVMYVVNDGNYIILKYNNGRALTLLASLQNFIQITEAFSDLHFERLGRSYIINTSYISHINNLRRTVTLADDKMKENVELIAPKESIRALRQSLLDTSQTPISGFQTANGNMEAFQVIK